MRTIEERVSRLERLLSRTYFNGPEKKKTRMSEREVMQHYDIGKDRLKQLRLGYLGQPPVLKKWTSIKGRRIEYDVAELDAWFKRDKIAR